MSEKMKNVNARNLATFANCLKTRFETNEFTLHNTDLTIDMNYQKSGQIVFSNADNGPGGTYSTLAMKVKPDGLSNYFEFTHRVEAPGVEAEAISTKSFTLLSEDVSQTANQYSALWYGSDNKVYPAKDMLSLNPLGVVVSSQLLVGNYITLNPYYTNSSSRLYFRAKNTYDQNSTTNGEGSITFQVTPLGGRFDIDATLNIPSLSINYIPIVASATELNYVQGVTSSIQGQLSSKAPISHATTETTYGAGTTSNYGHVKLQSGDMNGTNLTDGIAAGLGHSHSNYVLDSGDTMTGLLNITVTSGNAITANSTIQATSFNASSDKRLKENLELIYGFEKSILDLPIYYYNFKGNDIRHVGCMAQDLQQICPEIVHEETNGYLSIEESKIVYLLLQEVKKLREEIWRLR